ncbi:MAG: hypothetical protein JO197_09180 [Acidobacteria bacterium]|nr:hypothetical protein [Acidobacteriota bacterium]MBV9477268.1 hypothetical protein [Acidobacteriota bacterium]
MDAFSCAAAVVAVSVAVADAAVSAAAVVLLVVELEAVVIVSVATVSLCAALSAPRCEHATPATSSTATRSRFTFNPLVFNSGRES